MNFTGLPGISGMVRVGPNDFLVVHDTKGPLEPRLGAISVTKEDGPKYRAVEIRNWPINEKPPNDLEGICRISKTSSEFLIVEAGYYPKGGHFGRIIKLRYPVGIPGHAEYLGMFRPFSPPPNNTETPTAEQIEGIAIVLHEAITVLLIALRGGKERQNNKNQTSAEPAVPGQLIWGALTNLDSSTPSFEKLGSYPLTCAAIGDRGAADLYVTEDEDELNRWKVYSVATSDPKKFGPFRSAVYLAGRLIVDVCNVRFNPESSDKIVHWDFQGLKVEAIAAPAQIFEDTGGLSIATDDEVYNGIWRAIGRSKPQETVAPSRSLFSNEAKEGLALK